MTDTATVPALPTVGLHRGLAPEVYHSWKLASSSYLGAMKKSPAHAWSSMNGVFKRTDALILGDAMHFCILQPNEFFTRYLVNDQCKEKTQKGTRCKSMGSVFRAGDWFCKTHDPTPEAALDERQVLTSEEYDQCQLVRDSVLSHPWVKDLMEIRSDVEISGVWKDPDTGVLCKMRNDSVCRSADLIVDLKSTLVARPDEFEKSVFKYGYYRQGAMYRMGWEVLDKPITDFFIVAFEKTDPWGVMVYRLSDKAMGVGRDELHKLIKQFKTCQDSGVWPGYSTDIREIDLPAWAFKLIEEGE